MLRFLSFNIVFQEVPGEVTLAINISGCPNCCEGCHSPYLQEDKGDLLDEDVIAVLLSKYGEAITCVCFMGGDNDPAAVERLSRYIRQISEPSLKTAWYSGRSKLPGHCFAGSFDYIKLGPYVEKLGGLDSPATNQRFYQVKDRLLKDMTDSFVKTNKA
ncbi:MAG: anaerobic ribonucleoside-triphosphate reductase activating protein [Paludibacter sp.]|nr:anaerobic ribonucleoside-triphosphate reductase activating protein [Paludibacter sp.]